MITAPPRESPPSPEAVPAQGQERLAKAANLGLSAKLVPKADAPNQPIQGMTMHAVERIGQAIEVLRALWRACERWATPPVEERVLPGDRAMWKRLSFLWSLVRTHARLLWFALRHPLAPRWLKPAAVRADHAARAN
jgi:hypothetical protein